MKIYTETPGLLLREMIIEDAPGLLAMDSDPAVYRYLDGTGIQSLEEAEAVVRYIRQQYRDNGIGRWALVRKKDEAFLGWCGIKLVNDAVTDGRTGYYDIGYRLLPAFWGQGYAGEAARAALHYAFGPLALEELWATVMTSNQASERIVLRLGMQPSGSFVQEGREWSWYRLDRTGYAANQ